MIAVFFVFLFLQGVLTQVTPATKIVLNRLGVFTVSSFHAYVCARLIFKLKGGAIHKLFNQLGGRGYPLLWIRCFA